VFPQPLPAATLGKLMTKLILFCYFAGTQVKLTLIPKSQKICPVSLQKAKKRVSYVNL